MLFFFLKNKGYIFLNYPCSSFLSGTLIRINECTFKESRKAVFMFATPPNRGQFLKEIICTYRIIFLGCLYESTGSCCCHPDVSVGMDVTLTNFTSRGQGTVRQAILYDDRSCFRVDSIWERLCRPGKQTGSHEIVPFV